MGEVEEVGGGDLVLSWEELREDEEEERGDFDSSFFSFFAGSYLYNISKRYLKEDIKINKDTF